MARKRNLTHGREDAQPPQYVFVLGFEHENRLRQIHLARDLHHALVADPFSFGKHGERIAAKRLVRENVQLQKTMLRHIGY